MRKKNRHNISEGMRTAGSIRTTRKREGKEISRKKKGRVRDDDSNFSRISPHAPDEAPKWGEGLEVFQVLMIQRAFIPRYHPAAALGWQGAKLFSFDTSRTRPALRWRSGSNAWLRSRHRRRQLNFRAVADLINRRNEISRQIFGM